VAGRTRAALADGRRCGRRRAVSPTRDPMPTVYQVHAQVPTRSLVLVLKTDAATAGIAPAAMAAVRAANRNIVVSAFTLSDRIREGRMMVGRRFAPLLLSILAAIATLMALLGIYAVLAYSVAQRRHEIGIRMALGAGRAPSSATSRCRPWHGASAAPSGWRARWRRAGRCGRSSSASVRPTRRRLRGWPSW